MEIYLIKSVACLTILFVFYKLILERESFHHFKRFYLLASLIGAFLIPLITFTEYVETQRTIIPVITSDFTSVTSSETEVTTNYIPMVLWSLYGLGVLFFSIKFFRNLFSIIQKIRNNPRYKANSFFHVLLNSAVIPHTFFSYIFLNKQKFEANEIPSEVIIHEHAHANQKHGLDILFIELAQIVFWFNPIIYLLKHSIKLNHEFLADQVVLRSGATTSEYQKILLAFSSNAQVPIMANSINYSSIKKRFTVMKTQTSPRTKCFRSLLFLPLLAILIYGFSTTKSIEISKDSVTSKDAKNQYNYATTYLEGAKRNGKKAFVLMITLDEIVLNARKISLETLTQDLNSYTENWEETDYTSAHPSILIASSSEEFLKKVDREFKKTNYSKANEGFSIRPTVSSDNPFQTSATREEMKEYNELAKKYNTMSKDDIFIEKKDVQRLKFIYQKMSDKQRADAEPFPKLPPPPPAPKAPKMNGADSKMPPPPPPPPAPKSPIDHVVKMAKKNASFYFEGRKISSDEAISLLKKNKNLNIETTQVNSKSPVVKISKKPSIIDKSTPMTISVVDMPLFGPSPNIDDPVIMLNYMVENGAEIWLDGKTISKAKGMEIIKSQKSVRIIKVETPHDKPAVIFGEYGC